MTDQKAQFEQMIEHAPNSIVLLDDYCISYANPKFIELVSSDESTDALQSKPFISYVHPNYLKHFMNWLKELHNTHQSKSLELILLKSNGSHANVEIMGNYIPQDGKLLLQLLINDLTEKKRLETELLYVDQKHSLTESVDEKLLANHIEHALKIAEGNKHHMALMFLDLDHFKLINELYGHKAGDFLIQAVTQKLKSVAKKSDIILPLGGDRFAIILQEIENLNFISHLIQKFLNAFSHPFLTNSLELYTTITAGISVFPENGVDGETLLKAAELAHYHAKQKGQNNYQFFTPIMANHIKEQTDLLYDLRQAIIKNEFFLVYQPIINTQTGKIVSLEALLRWSRANKEVLMPAEFLSLAEGTGLIFSIGEWAIQTACQQNKIWEENGIHPLPISINLSTRQVHVLHRLLDTIKTTLQDTKLSAQYLEFEMSENVTVLDIGADSFHALKKMGIKLAIDDFGASYFSLNELKRYHIDTIKIDRSLIKNMQDSIAEASIVNAILAMADKLDINVIAEGIESREQLDYLKNIGCHYVQGNYIFTPLTAEQLSPILKENAESMGLKTANAEE